MSTLNRFQDPSRHSYPPKSKSIGWFARASKAASGPFMRMDHKLDKPHFEQLWDALCDWQAPNSQWAMHMKELDTKWDCKLRSRWETESSGSEMKGPVPCRSARPSVQPHQSGQYRDFGTPHVAGLSRLEVVNRARRNPSGGRRATSRKNLFWGCPSRNESGVSERHRREHGGGSTYS
jgi:hypothetical protein